MCVFVLFFYRTKTLYVKGWKSGRRGFFRRDHSFKGESFTVSVCWRGEMDKKKSRNHEYTEKKSVVIAALRQATSTESVAGWNMSSTERQWRVISSQSQPDCSRPLKTELYSMCKVFWGCLDSVISETNLGDFAWRTQNHSSLEDRRVARGGGAG